MRLPRMIFDKHVSFVVTVEAPVILVEATYSHDLTVVNRDRFHVQVLEWFFVNLSALELKVVKEIRVKESLVARLVSVPCCDDLYFYASLLHCFDQLIFKFVNVLYVWLDNADVRVGCFDHVEDLLTDLRLIWRLLLNQLA